LELRESDPCTDLASRFVEGVAEAPVHVQFLAHGFVFEQFEWWVDQVRNPGFGQVE
jgi:hypothetical protein